MYTLLLEYKNNYGNLLCTEDSRKEEIISHLKNKGFGFISPFPEGDGLCFSLGKSCKDLSPEEKEFVINSFKELLKEEVKLYKNQIYSHV